MSGLHIAPDGDGEMTVWNGDQALLRRCEVDVELWGLVVAGVEHFPEASAIERLERDAIRVIALFLTVMGGRVVVPDETIEALPYDAVVVRWRDHARMAEVWELQVPEPAPAQDDVTPIHDQLAAESVLAEAAEIVDNAGPEDTSEMPPESGDTA